MEIPPANETRKSVQRFHEAVLRMELVEFAWRKLGPGGLRDCGPKNGQARGGGG